MARPASRRVLSELPQVVATIVWPSCSSRLRNASARAVALADHAGQGLLRAWPRRRARRARGRRAPRSRWCRRSPMARASLTSRRSASPTGPRKLAHVAVEGEQPRPGDERGVAGLDDRRRRRGAAHGGHEGARRGRPRRPTGTSDRSTSARRCGSGPAPGARAGPTSRRPTRRRSWRRRAGAAASSSAARASARARRAARRASGAGPGRPGGGTSSV